MIRRNSVTNSRFHLNERAAVETFGYVLLVAIVFFSVGAVMLMGAPVIEDQQESEYMSNTVRAFEVFSNNLDGVERDRAPARETEIRYQGGVLFQSEDFFMEVDVTHDGNTENYFFASTPLTYAKEDSSVHYEAGSVIHQNPTTGSMRSEPPFDFSEDRTRMSVVTTTVREEQQSLSGSGKIAIVSKAEGSQTKTITGHDSSESVNIEVTVSSPRYESWAQYFEDQDLTIEEIDHNREEVTVSHQSDEVAIRETLISIDARN